jgi:putative transposase
MRVTRSAYYSFVARQTAEPSAAVLKLAQQVKQVFHENRRRYGTRRVVQVLRQQGQKIGRCLVRRLLKEQHLKAIQPKRYVPQTTQPNHPMASPNLLKDKANQATAPRTVIIGDITYLPMAQGRFCYLASWQDQFTRRIVGWKVDQTMTEELVMEALRKALQSGRIAKNAILHTDRGSQYSARQFRSLLAAHNLRQSMSAKGNCYDNAQAESFFARYKTELLEDGRFENLAQAISETFSYIEGYYNRTRLHSGLNYQSPEQFENNFNQNLPKGELTERFVSSFT